MDLKRMRTRFLPALVGAILMQVVIETTSVSFAIGALVLVGAFLLGAFLVLEVVLDPARQAARNAARKAALHG
jgi:hypothetical protein